MSKYLANFVLSVVVFIVLPIISTLLIMRAVAGVDVRGALIQADEYANITTGGNRDETWSSRFGRGKLAGRKRYVVLAAIVDFFAFVFAGQKNHCVDAINEQFLESGDAKTNF